MPDGSVIFSEINANRLIKIDNAGTFSTFLENTGGTTGLQFDRQGRLYAAVVPWGSTKFSIIYPEAAKKVVIDNYEGKAFGRPNDLVILRNGGMYFTDSANAQPRPAEPLPLPAAFYYLPPGATQPKQLLTDVGFPNGVILSRDEKVLYLNNSAGEYLHCLRRAARRLAHEPPQLRKVPGRQTECRWSAAERRRRPHNRRPGAHLCGRVERRPGVLTTGTAPRHDPDAQIAAEPGLRRPRQENAVHRRTRSGVEGADACGGVQGPPEIE